MLQKIVKQNVLNNKLQLTTEIKHRAEHNTTMLGHALTKEVSKGLPFNQFNQFDWFGIKHIHQFVHRAVIKAAEQHQSKLRNSRSIFDFEPTPEP